jgi:hypothetical protein
MKVLKRLVCRVRGHDPIRFSVGKCWLDCCLRCKAQLDIHEEF